MALNTDGFNIDLINIMQDCVTTLPFLMNAIDSDLVPI